MQVTQSIPLNLYVKGDSNDTIFITIYYRLKVTSENLLAHIYLDEGSIQIRQDLDEQCHIYVSHGYLFHHTNFHICNADPYECTDIFKKLHNTI